MSVEVKVPAVGESISSGVVSVWHKKSGEQVSAGDPLFTLETDKVSTEINADADGVLKTLVAEGAEVKIGDVVATIESGDGAKPEKKAEPGPAKSDVQKRVPSKEEALLSPAARRIVTEEKLDPQELRGSGKGGRVMKSDANRRPRKRRTITRKRNRRPQCSRKVGGSRGKKCRRCAARLRLSLSWRSILPRSLRRSTNAI
jgi:2-oxoglutarate dehydrogenase E2 component (dihydrolipoamide succinyltransferase)